MTAPANPPRAANRMGHGWVRPNPDGSRARCGGLALCAVCQREQAQMIGQVSADLRAALAPVASGWQPIATAPKDGTRVLLWSAGEHCLASWCVSPAPYKFEGWSTGWETAGGYDVGYASVYEPTHWQPLPAGPGA